MRAWGSLLSLCCAAQLTCACDDAVLPTRSEEQLRIATALSSQLARSLETLPGISDAHVHLALASAPDFASESALPASASVLLHADGDRARVDVAAVQALVAGAVPQLTAQAVHVIVARVKGAPTPAPPRLVRLGPFLVAQSSAQSLRALLTGLLVVQVVLALLLCFVVARQRGRGAAGPSMQA